MTFHEGIITGMSAKPKKVSRNGEVKLLTFRADFDVRTIDMY